MKIDGADYLFYATGHTTGTAKDTITMLENKHRDDYSMVKKDLIEMFDVTKNQELYEQFLQCFRQLHMETVTSFNIKFIPKSSTSFNFQVFGQMMTPISTTNFPSSELN